MPAIDVENAWGLDATCYGNHEFDFGVERLLAHQDRANFPFLARTSSRPRPVSAPDWVTPSVVFNVDGKKVGVIGAELENTPELVAAGATAGLTFLPEAPADQGRVRTAPRAGHQGPDRRDPRGHELGPNPSGNPAGVRGTARSSRSRTRCRTRPSTRWSSGHTHRVSNLMLGNILITEGINAGASYSVLQLMVQGGDVEWAGGATRIAKTIGVTPRADVRPSSTRRTPRPRRSATW